MKVMTKDFRDVKRGWIVGTVVKRFGTRVYLVKINSTGLVWKRHHDQLVVRKVRWEEEESGGSEKSDLGPLSEVDYSGFNSPDFCRSPKPWETVTPRAKSTPLPEVSHIRRMAQ